MSEKNKSRVHHVNLAPDYLQQLSRCHPHVGIAELVWNAMDAEPTRVDVWLRDSPLGGIEKIVVVDDGEGIDVTRVDEAFGHLGQSWKKFTKTTTSGRPLHGQHGRGRFRACTLGRVCTWDTVYRAVDGKTHAFTVTINTDRIKDVEILDITPATNKTGTTVTVSELAQPRSRSFADEAVVDYLNEHFGHFLLSYPAISIRVNGTPLNPQALIAHQQELPPQTVTLPNGTSAELTVRIIEWKKSGSRRIFLCDPSGMTVHDVPLRSHVLDDTVSVYVRSPFFATPNVANVASDQLEELEDVGVVLKAAREEIKKFEARREADRTRQVVQRWKDAAIYPYESEPSGAVEEVQRDVFHLVAQQIDKHLPHFHKAEPAVQRTMFQLVRHSVETKPGSLAKLIQGYSHIPATERERIERVLERTTLRRLFEGAELIQDRLAVLTGIDELLNNPKLRTQFAERKQLHEIVAANLWILDDNFYLSGSDQTLSRSVQKHVAALKGAVVVDPDFKVMDGRKRVDVMLTRQNRGNSFDHLVVELKRPTEKGGAAIITQMLTYAVALAEDPQWNNQYVKWTFWGIVHDLDPVGIAKIQQKDRAPGLVEVLKNSTIWLKTWSQVIADARKRLEFLRESLDVQTSAEHGLSHLASSYPEATPKAISSTAKIRKAVAAGTKLSRSKKTKAKARGRSAARA
jgi:hypothetical protein